MKDRKGSLTDMITLAVGAIPIVLIIIFASLLLMKFQVQATIDHDLETNTHRFEALNTMGVIMTDDELVGQMSEYTYIQDQSDKEDLNSTINDKLEEILEKQTVSYYFDLEGTDLRISEGEEAVPEREYVYTYLATPEGNRRVTIGTARTDRRGDNHLYW